MKRIGSCLAALTLVGCVLLVTGGTAEAGKRAPTRISIHGKRHHHGPHKIGYPFAALSPPPPPVGPPYYAAIYGRVKSPEAECVRHRSVAVFRQKGADPDLSKDKKVGSDRTNRTGRWRFTPRHGLPKGKYYAHAKRTPRCKAGFSRTIGKALIPPPPGA